MLFNLEILNLESKCEKTIKIQRKITKNKFDKKYKENDEKNEEKEDLF